MDTDISVSLQEAAIAIRYLENADAPFTLANCYDLLASLSLDKEMVEVGFALIPVLQMVYASENKTWIQMAELSAAKDRQEQEWNHLQIEETVSMYEANQKADEWMDQAIHDELTSLTSRRGFEQYFQARTSIIAREKKPFAIGMMDLDHFKEYNDHYGHVAGDMVLQNAAEVLDSCQQDDLIAARYGGDEFCFFAYDIDQSALEKILQEFQQKIRDLYFRHEYGGKDGMVSVSCGAAFYAGSVGQPELQACFEDADHVLYQIKRNRQGSFAASRCTLKAFEK